MKLLTVHLEKVQGSTGKEESKENWKACQSTNVTIQSVHAASGSPLNYYTANTCFWSTICQKSDISTKSDELLSKFRRKSTILEHYLGLSSEPKISIIFQPYEGQRIILKAFYFQVGTFIGSKM